MEGFQQKVFLHLNEDDLFKRFSIRVNKPDLLTFPQSDSSLLRDRNLQEEPLFEVEQKTNNNNEAEEETANNSRSSTRRKILKPPFPLRKLPWKPLLSTSLTHFLVLHPLFYVKTIQTALASLFKIFLQLLDILFGIPSYKPSNNLQQFLGRENSQFLIAELKIQNKSLLKPIRNYVRKELDNICKERIYLLKHNAHNNYFEIPYKFQTPFARLQIDLSLMNKRNFSKNIKQELQKILKGLNQNEAFYLLKREEIVRSIGTSESCHQSANDLLIDAYLTEIANQSDDKFGAETAYLLRSQLKLWNCLRKSKENYERILDSQLKAEIEKLKRDHELFSLDRIWLEFKEHEILERLRRNDELLFLELSIDGCGKEREEDNNFLLEQWEYFLKRQLHWKREIQPVLQKELQTTKCLKRTPLKTFQYSYRRKPLFTTNSSTRLYRVVNLFARFFTAILNLAFLCFVKLPLQSKFSFKIMFKDVEDFEGVPRKLSKLFAQMKKRRLKSYHFHSKLLWIFVFISISTFWLLLFPIFLVVVTLGSILDVEFHENYAPVCCIVLKASFELLRISAYLILILISPVLAVLTFVYNVFYTIFFKNDTNNGAEAEVEGTKCRYYLLPWQHALVILAAYLRSKKVEKLYRVKLQTTEESLSKFEEFFNANVGKKFGCSLDESVEGGLYKRLLAERERVKKEVEQEYFGVLEKLTVLGLDNTNNKMRDSVYIQDFDEEYFPRGLSLLLNEEEEDSNPQNKLLSLTSTLFGPNALYKPRESDLVMPIKICNWAKGQFTEQSSSNVMTTTSYQLTKTDYPLPMPYFTVDIFNIDPDFLPIPHPALICLYIIQRDDPVFENKGPGTEYDDGLLMTAIVEGGLMDESLERERRGFDCVSIMAEHDNNSSDSNSAEDDDDDEDRQEEDAEAEQFISYCYGTSV